MDYFNYKNDILYAEDCAISSIAAQVGTPFYCYSAATLRRHARAFAEGIGANITKKICFAVKSNSHIAVLKILADEGYGADVVSGGEIRLALAAGIAPANIVFSGVGKTRDEMEFALEHGIFQFNVESKPELTLLNEVAAGLKKMAAIAVRVNPDVDAKTHAKISTGKSENKFGIPIEQAVDFYAYAASLPAINVQSISVHIGSQLTDLEPFRHAFERVKTLAATLKQKGHNITVLDLGGGLGIPYDNTPLPTPAEYGAVVREVFSDFEGTLVFEPGRLIAGNAGILVSEVLYIKEGEGKTFAIVDAAMNDLMRPSLYDAYHEIVPVIKNSAAKNVLYDIVGPVCETGDTFAKNRTLPTIVAGDLLAFRSAGAYGAVMSSTYNARPVTPEVMVDGSKWAIIRKRASYDDMLATQLIPEWL